MSDINVSAGSLLQAALDDVARARARVAELATREIAPSAADLVDAATVVYCAEAILQVAETIERIVTNGGNITNIRQYAFETLSRGADDTWSGRRNDLARTAHDAVRTALGSYMRLLER